MIKGASIGSSFEKEMFALLEGFTIAKGFGVSNISVEEDVVTGVS